jgi:hypothetical protein
MVSFARIKEMMKRREYQISIVFNETKIKKIIIDPHYELKHAESISDAVIIGLVKTLDGRAFPPEEVKPPYTYFSLDKIELEGKRYKLVWVLEDDQIYVGIINAYRR